MEKIENMINRKIWGLQTAVRDDKMQLLFLHSGNVVIRHLCVYMTPFVEHPLMGVFESVRVIYVNRHKVSLSIIAKSKGGHYCHILFDTQYLLLPCICISNCHHNSPTIILSIAVRFYDSSYIEHMYCERISCI